MGTVLRTVLNSWGLVAGVAYADDHGKGQKKKPVMTKQAAPKKKQAAPKKKQAAPKKKQAAPKKNEKAGSSLCVVQIAGTDQMQYDKKKISVASHCKSVQLTLEHSGKLPKAAMGHNWILVKKEDLSPVVAAALQAGPSLDYTPKNDKRIIAHTGMVGGQEKTTTTFELRKLEQGKEYQYFCSFPGHSGLMRGVFVWEKGKQDGGAKKLRGGSKKKT